MFKIPISIFQEMTIQKPVDQVYETLVNFEKWKNWSPWLCMEPAAKIQTQNEPGTVGHTQSWEGHLIGSGQMTLGVLQKNKEVRCNLQFFKPWKSQSTATFKLTSQGNNTIVRWEMESTLPIFLIFFKKMMIAMINNDFKRGLSMLKDYVETGKVLSTTEIKGTETKPGFYYVGVPHEAKITDLGPLMKQDFTTMGGLIHEGVMPHPAFMLAIYHKFDMVNGDCQFTSAFAYKNELDAKTALEKAGLDHMKSSYITEHKGFQVTHTGAYEHLGNAWSTAMSAQRQQKLKSDKHVDMYEVYVNTPMNAAIKDLKTQIIIPVR